MYPAQLEPVPAPSGAPTWPPAEPLDVKVIDTLLDWSDWIGLVVTIISAFTAIVAIYLAHRANQIARQSEQRSADRAVRERRRVFELEALRDLLDALDTQFDTPTWAPQMPPAARTRLAMIPSGELLEWRLVAGGDRNAIAKRFETATNVEVSGAQPSLTDNIRFALREDLTRAIEARMRGID